LGAINAARGVFGLVAVVIHIPHLGIVPSEIIGTGMLILLGDGVVAAVVLAKSKAENSGWIVITWGWGMAVMIGVYAGHFSGAHLNPAVTLAFWIHGTITGSQAWKYFLGEMIGAMVGATLVFAAYYLHFRETEDPGLKLAVFSTGPAIRNYGANLVTEIIGTFVLVFGILMIIAPWTTVGTGALAPLLIGLLVLVIGLCLGGPTGYAINPARDLGPRIMHQILPVPGKGPSDWSYAWVPVLGPLIGGALAAIFFDAVFGSFPL
jgi:glycerol uptake facilitator protein